MRHDVKSLMDLEPKDQSPTSRMEIMSILLASIRDIELQLGSKERADITGVKLTPKQFLDWRKKAIKAMNHMTSRYREYKALLSAEKTNEYQARTAAGPAGPSE